MGERNYRILQGEPDPALIIRLIKEEHFNLNLTCRVCPPPRGLNWRGACPLDTLPPIVLLETPGNKGEPELWECCVLVG